MEKPNIIFSGRVFSAEDIEKIVWTRKAFSRLSLRELALTICETLGWMSKTGIPKRKECTELIRQMASEGIIDLPRLQSRNKTDAKINRDRMAANRADALSDDNAEVTVANDITLEIASTGPRMQLLRAYLRKYHMLGDNAAYGDQIHYFIKDGEGKELGCMRFSVASWSLEAREGWIGWTAEQRKARLFLIINQSRYLVFPWVHVMNLSSRALSKAARRLPGDWLERYFYEPVLIETFVDKSLFNGTSYKAANWTLVGQTKGRGRNDRYNEYALSVKDIYMYPLRRDFREILLGEKPYRSVDPYE